MKTTLGNDCGTRFCAFNLAYYRLHVHKYTLIGRYVESGHIYIYIFVRIRIQILITLAAYMCDIIFTHAHTHTPVYDVYAVVCHTIPAGGTAAPTAAGRPPCPSRFFFHSRRHAHTGGGGV